MKKKKTWIIALIIIILLLLLLMIYLLFFRTKSFTVTFDTDGGTTISEIKVLDGEVITLPTAPTKEGYTFIGWTDKNGRIVTKGTKFEENTNLKAKWIKNDTEIIDVTFDTDGGNEIGNITMEKDQKILLPTDPIKEGYIFCGWLNEEGKLLPKDIVISENTKLKAYWIKKDAKTYTISFNTDGGNKIDNILQEVDKKIVLPVNPSKDGFVFGGWIDEDKNAITEDTIINKDITIKAIWKDPYTCPSDCTPIGDGSKCTKELTTDMVSSSTCPSGYTMNSGKCTGTKYYAENTSSGWACNNSSDYMYSEEDGFGGAFMWCVSTTSAIKKQGCPSGYTQNGNTCKKTETINCTAN